MFISDQKSYISYQYIFNILKTNARKSKYAIIIYNWAFLFIGNKEIMKLEDGIFAFYFIFCFLFYQLDGFSILTLTKEFIKKGMLFKNVMELG